MKKQIVKGFKNGRRTATGFICKDFEFKVGETYKCDGSRIKLCMNGFHFHRNPFDLFTYYDMDIDITVAEIQASGFVIDGENKSVCSEIKIIKILNEEELSILGNTANNFGWANTGNSNTGYRNTGNRNTGYRNTGYRNTGNRNTGNRNTGNWNTGDWNTGNSNTGDSNTGDSNTGNSNTGDSNTGNSNTGYSNTGYRNTGDSNTGNSNTGYSNTGDSNTGDSNTGDSNTGDSNTGYSNTGDWNTGDSNTGNRNTGYRNTGDSNTGNWNKTNRSSGFFNTFECISVFNKPCDISVWNKTIIPNFLYSSSDWNENIRNITIKEIELLCDIPNFDPEIFYEISGLSIDDLYYYEILFRKF